MVTEFVCLQGCVCVCVSMCACMCECVLRYGWLTRVLWSVILGVVTYLLRSNLRIHNEWVNNRVSGDIHEYNCV